MALFSQRKGLTPMRKAIQTDSIDRELRNRLWNAFLIHCWDLTVSDELGEKWIENGTYQMCQWLWCDFFKLPFDEIPSSYNFNTMKKSLKAQFMENMDWYHVYDFIEFVAKRFPYEKKCGKFKRECNRVLEEESSAYRFVEDEIACITSEEEIGEIEEALEVPLKPVSQHIRSSLQKLTDRKKPDYRNSVKEAISAVESMCSLLAGKKKADLSEALKIIKQKVRLHPALEQAFNKLYGYTCDEDGVRHALMEEAKVGFEEAKFMLVSCSAFVNYLVSKAAKAAIELSATDVPD
jgi:hypothetical protein